MSTPQYRPVPTSNTDWLRRKLLSYDRQLRELRARVIGPKPSVFGARLERGLPPGGEPGQVLGIGEDGEPAWVDR